MQEPVLTPWRSRQRLPAWSPSPQVRGHRPQRKRFENAVDQLHRSMVFQDVTCSAVDWEPPMAERRALEAEVVALTRSQQMARIRSKDTAPERILAGALLNAGIVAERTSVQGRVTVDIAFPEEQLLVFIDGCFWHGCPDHYSRPRTNAEFWAAKLAGNVARDRLQTLRLTDAGWHVLRVWEHDVVRDVEAVVGRILRSAAAGPDSELAGWRVFQVDLVDDEQSIERRHLCDLLNPTRQMLVTGPRVTGKQRPSIKRSVKTAS